MFRILTLVLSIVVTSSMFAPGSVSANDCPTALGPDGIRLQIDVTNCGVNSASPYDAEEDSPEIQHAIDQIKTNPGGGYVYFPPDTNG
ncbi:MAG: hypothetical protein ACREA0_23625, partial [bacterium]